MLNYIVRRLVEMGIALLVMSLLVFVLGRSLGDPVGLLLDDFATEADRQELIRQLGLDRPLPVQYVAFLGGALRGDLGRSVRGDRQPVMKLIMDRLPASFLLAATAMSIGLAVGIPLGVTAAVRAGSWLDGLARGLALLGQSVPVFWLGIVLILLFSVQLGWLPTSGYGGVRHFVLPAVTMSTFIVAAVTRLVRIGMIEALGSEYVRLARMKGLSERTVIWKHALRNSLMPVITYMGAFFAIMITGAVVIETVFGWPGIGRLAYEAILERNFPLMQAVVLVMAVVFMLANLSVDVVHAMLDPRIRR